MSVKTYSPQTVQIAQWLSENGANTRTAVAYGTGLSINTVRKSLTENTELFEVVGYRKSRRGVDAPVYIALCVPSYIGRAVRGQYPAAERIRRWLLERGRPANAATIAEALGLHIQHVQSTIGHNRSLFVKINALRPARLWGGVAALWWPARILPGDEVTLIHDAPPHLPPVVIRGVTADGRTVRAHGMTYGIT